MLSVLHIPPAIVNPSPFTIIFRLFLGDELTFLDIIANLRQFTYKCIAVKIWQYIAVVGLVAIVSSQEIRDTISFRQIGMEAATSS